jgi:hypothetical protein
LFLAKRGHQVGLKADDFSAIQTPHFAVAAHNHAARTTTPLAQEVHGKPQDRDDGRPNTARDSASPAQHAKSPEATAKA